MSNAQIKRLTHVVEAFRELEKEIPSQTMHLFLLIADNPGITTPDLMKKTGLSQPSVSRHLAMLSEDSWNGKPGFGVISQTIEGRAKSVKLNSKGRMFAARIARLMDPSAEVGQEDF